MSLLSRFASLFGPFPHSRAEPESVVANDVAGFLKERDIEQEIADALARRKAKRAANSERSARGWATRKRVRG